MARSGWTHTEEAKEKIRLFREDEVWAGAAEARKIKMVRSYMLVYPDAKHLDEAQDLLKVLVDEEWEKTAAARSEGDNRAGAEWSAIGIRRNRGPDRAARAG